MWKVTIHPNDKGTTLHRNILALFWYSWHTIFEFDLLWNLLNKLDYRDCLLSNLRPWQINYNSSIIGC